VKAVKLKETNFWNSFSVRYDSFIKHTVGNAYLALYKNLKEDVTLTDHMLEIATGTGLVSFEICKQVYHIDAIDIAPGMIRIAKIKQAENNITNIDFQVGDTTDLLFSDSTFDVVLASNVMHLLSEPECALSEILRVLKPDGRAILPTFCHGENIKSRIISCIMSLSGFKARNKWSTESFKKFVEYNGFKVLKCRVIRGKIPLAYVLAEKL
jgi:ubiquinone/menaquinone biosynthesis C-methylase UbiE